MRFELFPFHFVFAMVMHRFISFCSLKTVASVHRPQVCDSDTKLDPLATVELCKVLESNPKYGAVGGDVMILNLKDSYVSFMSSLRYWMAFNVERSCQSFFNCVSCISGPLGEEERSLSGLAPECQTHHPFLTNIYFWLLPSAKVCTGTIYSSSSWSPGTIRRFWELTARLAMTDTSPTVC